MQSTNTKIVNNINFLFYVKWCSIDELKQLFKKGIYIMRDNNCKENHERGLQKRKEMFGIQETVHSLQARKRLVELNQFYSRTLKMLKLA